MASAFSPHNPTAHLKSDCCDHNHGPKINLPDLSQLEDPVTIYPLSVDPTNLKVSLKTKSTTPSKSTDSKLLEETLAIINDYSQYLTRAPFPHCPPPPQPTQNNPRSQQVNMIKEQGNVAFKSNNFTQAIELYSAAADLAATRPLFEPSVLVKEELSVVLCNRAAAYCASKMWVEALCDANAVIQLKRNWSKGHFRKVKALQGLGRLEEAKDAALLGLEFEPDNVDLRAAFQELK